MFLILCAIVLYEDDIPLMNYIVAVLTIMSSSTIQTVEHTLLKYSRSYSSDSAGQPQWQHYNNATIKLIMETRKANTGSLESIRLRIYWTLDPAASLGNDSQNMIFVRGYGPWCISTVLCDSRKILICSPLLLSIMLDLSTLVGHLSRLCTMNAWLAFDTYTLLQPS
jgi:hypothetical protein